MQRYKKYKGPKQKSDFHHTRENMRIVYMHKNVRWSKITAELN